MAVGRMSRTLPWSMCRCAKLGSIHLAYFVSLTVFPRKYPQIPNPIPMVGQQVPHGPRIPANEALKRIHEHEWSHSMYQFRTWKKLMEMGDPDLRNHIKAPISNGEPPAVGGFPTSSRGHQGCGTSATGASPARSQRWKAWRTAKGVLAREWRGQL